MIKLRRRPLRSRDLTALQGWQRQLDGVAPYDKRIGTLWEEFTAKPLRKRIWSTLEYQCVCRCVYCEQSAMETIDHFAPKKQFPGTAFAWENFNGACWVCNGSKGQPLVFQNGRPKLINPMDEDPARFFHVDPRNGWMTPALHLQETDDDYIRADYTIIKLKLNERGLPKQRTVAAANLRRALTTYLDTDGNRSAEKALLVVFRESNALRAVVRQMMTDPDPPDKPLVNYCLENSPKVRIFLQAIGWL